MTDLDLTEAIDAAAGGVCQRTDPVNCPNHSNVTRIVETAAPFITAQVERRVRETIANDIEKGIPKSRAPDESVAAARAALHWAADIAQGGAA